MRIAAGVRIPLEVCIVKSERAQLGRVLGARGAEQRFESLVRQPHMLQLERAQRGHPPQRRRQGARRCDVQMTIGEHRAFNTQRAQTGPGFGSERLEGRLVGPPKRQLLEARPAPRHRRARGSHAEVGLQLGRRLVNRAQQLGVHEAQSLAVHGPLQCADDERGGGGRAHERVQQRRRLGGLGIVGRRVDHGGGAALVVAERERAWNRMARPAASLS
jgi:hypothetical protein